MLDDLYYFILAVMSILVMFYNYEVPPKDKIDHGKKYRTMDEKDRKEKAVKLEVKAIRRHVTNLDTVDGFDGVKPKIVAKSAKQSLKKKTSLRLALHESNSKKKVIEEEDEVFFGGVRRNASMTTVSFNYFYHICDPTPKKFILNNSNNILGRGKLFLPFADLLSKPASFNQGSYQRYFE